jgi:serine/threonine protein kinase
MIRNKFQVTAEINRGAFGVIYVAQVVAPTRMAVALRAPTQVAVKYEFEHFGLLRHESTMIHLCNRHQVVGIPQMHWFGPALPPAQSSTNVSSFTKDTLYPCMASNKDTLYPCMVMTFYDTTLKQFMEHHRWDRVVIERTMDRLLTILSRIHDLYMVHRDLKPDNIMVKNGEVYLIDFGLATFYVDGGTGKHVDAKATHHQTLVGSPLYASYYVHVGETHTRRDDLIQLGYIYLYLRGKGAPLPWQRIEASVRPIDDESFSPGHILHPQNQLRAQYKQLGRVLDYLPAIESLGGSAAVAKASQETVAGEFISDFVADTWKSLAISESTKETRRSFDTYHRYMKYVYELPFDASPGEAYTMFQGKVGV